MEKQRFLAYWGLRSLPGNGPMDLEQLYWQDHTQILCNRLLLSLEKTAKLSVLIAPAGHGKSTLARWLYHKIDAKTHDVALFSLLKHEVTPGWLLPRMAHYLGLPDSLREPRQILQNLRTAHGKVLTIIVDNAHFLSEATAFDEISSLCQVQALVECRINFVLIGNPSLAQALHSNRDLPHRVSLLGEILLFSKPEFQAYLSQQLQDLGISRRILPSESLMLILQQGPMSFSRVNAILEACLFEAFLKEQKTISKEVVLAACENSGLRLKKEDGDAAKSNRVGSKKNPPVTAMRSVSGSGDLNSLFYKVDAEHDGDD